MVADVQDWLDNPAGNFGWLVLGDEKPTLTAKRFDTRESANLPVLTVQYTPPSPPPCPPPFCEPAVVSEYFDGVTPPALPPDWVAINAQGPPPLWVTSDSGVPMPPADTPPNAAFIDDPAVVSDKRLDSRNVAIFEGYITQLTFRHNFNLEASDVDPNLGFDGGVLEVSTDGGNTFQDILAAGGTFEMGGYNRTISTDRGSPIAGRQAWSGNSEGFITSVVDLPQVGGLDVRLRWRMASDNTGSSEGWRVDTVNVFGCHFDPSCTPTPTSDCDRHSNCYCYCDTNSDSDSYGYAYADLNGNCHNDTDGYAHRNSKRYTSA